MLTDRVSEQEKAFKAKQAELEEKMHAKSKVVYATKDISKGAVIDTDSLEEREVEFRKIPNDAMTDSSECVGQKAKYTISAGQIVGQADIGKEE